MFQLHKSYKWEKRKLAQKKGKKSDFQNLPFVWCLQESNQGHKDFQSFALPTELRHQQRKYALQRYYFFNCHVYAIPIMYF